jgi:PIN domain nuclease of toxin-antitoxin system
MLDAYTQKYVSIASIWEFAIKYGMGKIQFDGGLRHLWDLITQYNFTILPITKPYLAVMIELPFIHRDPFDRMLIATAKAENMSILTADENIHKYDVASVW